VDSNENKQNVEDPEIVRKRMEELKANRNKLFATDANNQETELNELVDSDLNNPAATAQILKESSEQRTEVSAVTIGRMLGLVTMSEFRLVENKMDLLSSRLNTAILKLDKVSATLSQIPTGSDLERIDVQIGALRTLIKDTIGDLIGKAQTETSNDKVSTTKIMSND
jgi:hypothetical protein